MLGLFDLRSREPRSQQKCGYVEVRIKSEVSCNPALPGGSQPLVG